MDDLRLSRYRHVIWDWNGTLLDDVDLCVEVMNGLLGSRGLAPLDRARYRAEFGFPVRDFYARLGFDVAGEFEALSVEFISAYDARRFECRLHAGAAKALSQVAAAGLTQSILSAYRWNTLREIVGHFGIAPYFVRLNGLDNIHAHSKIELGLDWMKELGLPRGQVLMIGDTLHDLDVAQALGVDCVLVAAGHHTASRLRTRSPFVVEDLPAAARRLGLTGWNSLEIRAER